MQRDKRLCVFISEQQDDLTIVFLGTFYHDAWTSTGIKMIGLLYKS